MQLVGACPGIQRIDNRTNRPPTCGFISIIADGLAARRGPAGCWLLPRFRPDRQGRCGTHARSLRRASHAVRVRRRRTRLPRPRDRPPRAVSTGPRTQPPVLASRATPATRRTPGCLLGRGHGWAAAVLAIVWRPFRRAGDALWRVRVCHRRSEPSDSYAFVRFTWVPRQIRRDRCAPRRSTRVLDPRMPQSSVIRHFPPTRRAKLNSSECCGSRIARMAAPRGVKRRPKRTEPVELMGVSVAAAVKARARATAQAADVSLSAYIEELIKRDQLDEIGRPCWAGEVFPPRNALTLPMTAA